MTRRMTFNWTAFTVLMLSLLSLTIAFARALPETSWLASATVDLDVTYISRTPRYSWEMPKQWPDPGEIVTFKAHVINKGNAEVETAAFEWRIDGQIVESGDLGRIAPGQERTDDLIWAWQTGQHTVEFHIDPTDIIVETAEQNNVIEDPTDAMAIGFWVEQSIYDEFNSIQNGSGTFSWEDWAQQLIVERMNFMFEQSAFPLAPSGALTRVRLDKVTIVPDNTIFALGPQHAPWESETDVQWGFSIQEYQNCSIPLCYDEPWWVIHELMHYLYGRIDLYAFDVEGGDVDVRDEHDDLIAGTELLPYIRWDIVHYGSRSYDLMGSGAEKSLFSEHTIYGLNKDWPAGERTHQRWSYFSDALPAETRIRVLDTSNQPIPNMQVLVYQAVPGDGASGPYSQFFDNIPDLIATTNSQGIASLGGEPFGNLESFGTPAGVLLIKLSHPTNNLSRYIWFELMEVNLAFWRGETNVYVHDLYFPSEETQLKLSNNSIYFVSSKEVSPRPQTVQIDLVGENGAEWSVTKSDQPWLRTIPSPDFSSQSYPSGPLTFIVDAAGLPPGEYASQVEVSAANSALDSPQSVTVRLTLTNRSPLAATDSYFITVGQTLNVPMANGVLANDSDPDGDPISAELVDEPNYGVLVLNADGSFTYTPDSGFRGQDSFTYKAMDGSDESNAAVVTIQVDEAAFLPIIW